jgi:5-hydroxyisourate hydrolase
MAGMTISTHVLDTGRGQPAAGVHVELFGPDGSLAGEGTTDTDGRIGSLGSGPAGTYRIVFHPPSPFFTRVELEVALDDGHVHLPLLISPYGCASYRGS